MKRLLTLAAVMVMTAGLSGAAAFTLYFAGSNGGQTGWQTAVGSFTTFSFTGNFNANAGPTTINPVQSGNNNYSGLDLVNNNYKDLLTIGAIPNASDPTLLAVSSTTYTWMNGASSLPMTAFAAAWDTSPLSPGGGIVFTFNFGNVHQQAATLVSSGGAPFFLGFISDTPFDSVTLSTTANQSDSIGRPYGAEHYTVDDLKVAGGAVSGVPEPATLSMVGIALLGLGALRRYRRG